MEKASSLKALHLLISAILLINPSNHTVNYGFNLPRSVGGINNFVTSNYQNILPNLISNKKAIWARINVYSSNCTSANALHGCQAVYNNYSIITKSFSGYNIIGTISEYGIDEAYGYNWTLQNWNAYVTDVVAANPNIHVWEIWNEIDVPIERTGYLNSSDNTALLYFNLLKNAYTIIKAQNASDKVLAFGGMAVFVPNKDTLNQYNKNDFTNNTAYQLANQIWSYGAAKYCDAISLHAYTHSNIPLQGYPSIGGVTSKLTYLQIWTGMANEYEKMTKKPVWFTETGLPSNEPIGDSYYQSTIHNQSVFLNKSFALFSSLSYSEAVLWWNLISVNYNNAGDDYGLIYTNNQTPKPSWNAFIKAAGISNSPSIPPPTLTIQSTTTVHVLSTTTAPSVNNILSFLQNPSLDFALVSVIVVFAVVLLIYMKGKGKDKGNQTTAVVEQSSDTQERINTNKNKRPLLPL